MLIGVGEFFLSTSWTPFFFRFGIPLYRKEFPVLGHISGLDEYIHDLESQVPRSWQQPAIAFKALSQQELAFRQKFGQRNPAHGHLNYDPRRQNLSLTGYLPWSSLLFPVIFLLALMWAPFEAIFLFLFVFLALFAFGILMAHRNYGRISKAITHTFQEQITTETTSNFPQAQSVEYEPYTPTYDHESGSPSSLTKQTSNSNRLILILIVMLVGFLIILGIMIAIFFLAAPAASF